MLAGHSRLMNGVSHGAEAIDHVMSAMCVLVHCQDKSICSHAADHWLQFVHQQHISAILAVDFCVRFNENEVGITEF